MKPGKLLKLVPVIILGLVAVSWWYLQQTNKTNDQINKDELSLSEQSLVKYDTIEYKDTAGLFSIKHPKDWKVQKIEGGNDSGIEAPDPTVVSQPFKILSPQGPDNNAAMVQALTDSFTLENVKALWKDNKHSAKTTKISGYNVDYVIYTFKGDAEGYTNHEYVVTKNGRSVMFTFRSRYNHDNVTPAVKWDDSKNTPGFLSIVRSIKFLK